MMYWFCFVICFSASVVGAICGIGGGVIIKPILDALGLFDVTTISFLSGCTVLSMTAYSVIRNLISKTLHVSWKTVFPLALGAAVGGLIGKWTFDYIKACSGHPNRVGAVQAACLMAVMIGTLTYTVRKDKVNTFQIRNSAVCALIGLILGVMSSFLGIGGGPINLVVLSFFFSMSTKEAAENSLYIIFCSQSLRLLSTLVTGSVPSFEGNVLLLMVLGGIAGGACGRAVNKKIAAKAVDKLFIVLMGMMILINLYDLCKYLAA